MTQSQSLLSPDLPRLSAVTVIRAVNRTPFSHLLQVRETGVFIGLLMLIVSMALPNEPFPNNLNVFSVRGTRAP